MALPYGPADAAPHRWTADSEQARLTIPYLGPEPRPSKAIGRAFLLACVLDVVIHLSKAWMDLDQAGKDRDFLAHPTRAGSAALSSGAHTLSTMGKVALGGIAVALVLDLVWRGQRRPARRRDQLGEAYVEHPSRWVTPIALRISWIVLAVTGFLLGANSTIRPTTAPEQYSHLRELQALSSLAWAGFWLSLVLWIVLVNRSHARRMAFSGPYRADPSQVPFFPPVRDGWLRKG